MWYMILRYSVCICMYAQFQTVKYMSKPNMYLHVSQVGLYKIKEGEYSEMHRSY